MKQELESLSSSAAMARMTRRALLWSAAAIGGVYGGWRWLVSGKPEEGLPSALRRVLRFNESIGSALSGSERLSPIFPKSAAQKLRVNGRIGLKSSLPEDLESFRLSVESPGLSWSREFSAIRMMKKVDVVTEHRCIEGWSTVVHWAGVPLFDFLAEGFGGEDWLLQSEGHIYKYLYAATPDSKYFVALDMESAFHPQTLLCWELNGQLLTPEHGAPLRLVVPIKYGIKSLKRVAVLRLSNQEPADYWRARGYDGYVGL